MIDADRVRSVNGLNARGRWCLGNTELVNVKDELRCRTGSKDVMENMIRGVALKCKEYITQYSTDRDINEHVLALKTNAAIW